MNPDFMKSYFTIKEIAYCLRNGNILKIPSAHSTCYGTNSVLFRACLVWNELVFLLNKVNHSLNLNLILKFKKKLTAPAKFAFYNFMVNID